MLSDWIQTTVEWWSEVDPGLLPETLQLTWPWARGLGAVSCWAPEPPPRPATSLGLGLEAAVNLFPIPASATLWWWQSAWVTVCGTWSPLFGWPEEPEGQLGWIPSSLQR